MSIGEGRRPGAARPLERRDPTAATTQLRFHGVGRPQVPDWDAQRAVTFGYHANVIAYRCAAVIADTIAGLAFRAGPALPEHPGAHTDHNPDAPLARLLGPPPGGPAPDLTARKLWAWTITQRLVTGRNAWEIETTERGGKGTPIALWPLTSAHLKAVPSTGGSRWFSRFEFGRAEDVKDLRPEQVHYGWTPSASDFRQPWSALQAARYALSIALGIDEYQYAFMRNGAVPAVVVGVEAFAKAEDFESFKRQWHGSYSGPANAGKTHFVELEPGGDDMKLSEALFIQTVGATAKDARIPETYRAALEQVAVALGVPWSKLDASGRTFDNASEEDRSFWQGTILPLATDLADEVNMGLAPRLGREVGWFDFSGVRALQPVPVAAPSEIPALIAAGVMTADEARPMIYLAGPAPEEQQGTDPKTAKVGAPSLLQAKLMTINEARTDLGLDPVDDGDRFLTDEEIAVAKALGGGEAAVRSVLDRIEVRSRRALPPAPQDRGPERRATPDQEARRSAIWRATDAAIRRQESTWTRVFGELFDKQERSTLARLKQSRSKPVRALEAAAEARAWADETRGPADGLFDPEFWRGETEATARTLFESLASSAFARLDDHFGVSFDLDAEFAQMFITSRSNQLAGQVTDTTYRAVTDALAAGVSEGDGIPQLAARVREVFDDAKGRRAKVIARTEVISGHNAAALSAASSLPADVVAAQQWIATRDGRTRPSHATADGQIVAVGQPFSVAGVAAAYPGDPSLPASETVQCRCAVAFLTPEEFTAEADAWAAAAAAAPVPIGRARTALALVVPGAFDEQRFRRAIEVAA